MTVGVIVCCIPSLACIIRHHAPDLSVLDYWDALKTKLNSICQRESDTALLGMRSHDNKVGQASLDNNSKKSGTSSSLNYSKVGNVAQITTRADHAGTLEIDQRGGFHAEDSWEQISQGKIDHPESRRILYQDQRF